MYCLDINPQHFPKQQNLDSSKMREYADDNFKFNENRRKFFKWVENTVGKGKIARYEQFFLFPQCFQKTCTTNTLKPELVWERINQSPFVMTLKERVLEDISRKGENHDKRHFLLFSSTGRRPASYCHGVVSVVRPSVRPCVRP